MSAQTVPLSMKPEKTNNTRPPITPVGLASLMLFKGEGNEVLEWTIEQCPITTLSAGDTLLSPQQHNDALYVILDGRVEVHLDWMGRQRLSHLEAGDCVGEMSIIERTRPSAYVNAATECRFLKIPEDTLWELIDRSSVVARNLLYIMSTRIRNSDLLIIESKHKQRVSERNALTDPLTALNNRRWLDESLPRLVRRSQLNDQDMGLLVLDIDHFKNYNDTQGHQAGDRAIATLAETLRTHIRPNDSAVRYGGEEFVVILPETNLEATRVIAQRLCDELRRAEVRADDDTPLPGFTVSVGLACLEKTHTASALFAQADQALYRAKQNGRDQVSE